MSLIMWLIIAKIWRKYNQQFQMETDEIDFIESSMLTIPDIKGLNELVRRFQK